MFFAVCLLMMATTACTTGVNNETTDTAVADSTNVVDSAVTDTVAVQVADTLVVE